MNKVQLQAKAEELGVDLNGNETSAILKAKIAEAERSKNDESAESDKAESGVITSDQVNEVSDDTDEPHDEAEGDEETADEGDDSEGTVTTEVTETERKELRPEDYPQGEPELEQARADRKAEEELVQENVKTVLDEPADDDKVLVRYTGGAGSYMIDSYKFSLRAPIQLVDKEYAETLTAANSDFKIVSEEDAKKFYEN